MCSTMRVEQHLTRPIVHDLVNAYSDASGFVWGKAHRVYVRIDHAPLAGPVGTYAIMAMDDAALHAIGPDHVGTHRGQGAVEVPCVEGGVSAL